MLAREDIQMVSVCIPNYLHKEAVIAAANAGKDIVCEKPLTTNLKDADEMVSTCNNKGVKLMYAEDWIFAPAIVRAKEIYKEGEKSGSNSKFLSRKRPQDFPASSTAYQEGIS